MNDFLISLLKIWGISSVITMLGCFLEPRLKYPDNQPGVKHTINECVLFLAVAPLSGILTIIAFVCYLCWWVKFFWGKIKDIEI